MGCVAWTVATIALAIALAMVFCGCNDSEDNVTTIEEAPVYEIGTNGNPIIVVQDIDGLVIVDLVTGQVEEQPYNVVVQNVGTGGVVSIKTSPYIPPPPSPVSP
jgi:hypothetical protein